MSKPSPGEPLALVRLALTKMQTDKEGWSRLEDHVCAGNWLFVLAAPHLFRSMSRVPPREHLLKMVDIFVERAKRGDHEEVPDFEPVPYEQREPLARKLRALIEVWTPPDLSAEIIETARALLHADGKNAPGGGWDAATIDGADSCEEILLWPEGVPAILRQPGAASP